MNPLDAGTTILYMFGIMDEQAKITTEEKKVFTYFFQRYLEIGYTSADIDHAINVLETLSPKGVEERFYQAVDYFKTNHTHEARIGMIDFIMYMIISDGKASELEIKWFHICCEHWGIDPASITAAWRETLK